MPGKSSGAKNKAAPEQRDGDGLVVLHRSRFVDWQPAPIVSLASSHDGSLAAAVRETGDIELYDTSNWHCFQTLPGSTAAASTCVALVDEDGGNSARLFSAGLDGLIHEQDAENRLPKASCDSYGGAVWQLEPEPLANVPQGELPRLAAACDDGCVRVFTVEPGLPGAAYSKSLPRVEGRALAVAWHPSGEVLASAGTDGCIHVWALKGNRELLRITVGGAGAARARDLVVWDLLFLPDGTLVSADSEGGVSFWDGASGTLLRRFAQHQADVLRLAASPDGRAVFAAGVDPQVATFQLVAGGEGIPQWAYLSSKRPHTHDVRALCVVSGKHAPEPVLLSGGNDMQLLVHSVGRFLKEHPLRANPCPQRPLCQASAAAEAASAAGGSTRGAPQPPRLLSSQRNQVDIWQLGTAAGGQLGGIGGHQGEGGAGEGAMVPPGAPPVHLARFQTKGGGFLTAAALSPAGDRVAFSDAKRVRAFQLAERPLPGGGEAGAGAAPPAAAAGLAVSPLPLPADLPPASHLAFLPGSNSLVACALDGTIRVLELGSSGGEAADGGSDGGGGAQEGPPDGEACSTVIIRDIFNLRHKIWAKRERHKSAARRLAPALDLLAPSPDGRWLAVAARQRVHLIDLQAGARPTAVQLPQPCDPARPISALAFTVDSSVLLAASAPAPAGARSGAGAPVPCQLAAYDVASGQLSTWSQQRAEELGQRLASCPGPAAGLACSPASPSNFLLHSPAAICHVDMAKPLFSDPYAAAAAGAKRRRGPARPLQTTAPAGENCRVLYADDPVLHVQYLSPDAVLVVEKAWSDVWQQMGLPPMYRHRYGT